MNQTKQVIMTIISSQTLGKKVNFIMLTELLPCISLLVLIGICNKVLLHFLTTEFAKRCHISNECI